MKEQPWGCEFPANRDPISWVTTKLSPYTGLNTAPNRGAMDPGRTNSFLKLWLECVLWLFAAPPPPNSFPAAIPGRKDYCLQMEKLPCSASISSLGWLHLQSGGGADARCPRGTRLPPELAGSPDATVPHHALVVGVRLEPLGAGVDKRPPPQSAPPGCGRDRCLSSGSCPFERVTDANSPHRFPKLSSKCQAPLPSYPGSGESHLTVLRNGGTKTQPCLASWKFSPSQTPKPPGPGRYGQ